MHADDRVHLPNSDRIGRAVGMTTLIPDGRRGLLGSLVDDATLLGPNDRSIEEVVAAYRSHRAGPTGWMVGRFVAPTSRLEDLASVLIRTMTSGEAPWSIVAVFDGPSPSAPSIAASFHAMMNPAASVDVIHLTADHADSATPMRDAEAAAAGVHHGVLPMLSAATRGVLERRQPSVGLVFDVNNMPPPDLSAEMQACARSGVPFTLSTSTLPGHTVADPSTGLFRIGAVNLLVSSLMANGATKTAIEAALCDTDPAGYAVGFGGLVKHGDPVHTGRPLSTDRAPLVSLAASEPGDALGALGRLESPG